MSYLILQKERHYLANTFDVSIVSYIRYKPCHNYTCSKVPYFAFTRTHCLLPLPTVIYNPWFIEAAPGTPELPLVVDTLTCPHLYPSTQTTSNPSTPSLSAPVSIIDVGLKHHLSPRPALCDGM